MSSPPRRILGSLILTWLFVATGCAEFDMSRRIPWKPEPTEEIVQAEKVVATWSDAISHNPKRSPERGIGGRLMFFEADNDNPIKVEGDLVVYAFDEDNPNPSDNKPDRKFVIRAETLETLYSESKIGHSYSVWLPWDEAGGPQKELSLIARLVPKEGSPIVGTPSKIILPGRKQAPRDEYAAPAGEPRQDATQPAGVQAAAYNRALGAPTGNVPARFDSRQMSASPAYQPGMPQTEGIANRMKTTTINIQPDYGRRTPVAERRTPRNRVLDTAATSNGRTTPARAESSSPRRSTRYSLSRSRPLGAPISRLSRDHGQKPPRLAGWRSPYQPQPGSATSTSAE